jgi:hypothetical protein
MPLPNKIYILKNRKSYTQCCSQGKAQGARAPDLEKMSEIAKFGQIFRKFITKNDFFQLVVPFIPPSWLLGIRIKNL